MTTGRVIQWGAMRWDGLFEDLAAQWEAEQRRDLDDEVADRTRRERAAVSLLDRLAAHRGGRVDIATRHELAPDLSGTVADVGGDWVLLTTSRWGSALLPLLAITAVFGLPSRVVDATAARRFGLGYALRALSRDRATVAVTDTARAVSTGTIDGVGADAIDLSEHPLDVARRTANIRRVRTIPFTALVMISSRG